MFSSINCFLYIKGLKFLNRNCGLKSSPGVMHSRRRLIKSGQATLIMQEVGGAEQELSPKSQPKSIMVPAPKCRNVDHRKLDGIAF